MAPVNANNESSERRLNAPENRTVPESCNVKSSWFGVRLQLSPGTFSATSASMRVICSSFSSLFRSSLKKNINSIKISNSV